MKCSRQRCTRRASVDGICKTHATKLADELWSRAVRDRDGRCLGAEHLPDIACIGSLQADHVAAPRSYHATRWYLPNGASVCLAHHKYLTEHPLHHEEFAKAVLGFGRFDAIRYRALHGDIPHLDDVLTRLRATVTA